MTSRSASSRGQGRKIEFLGRLSLIPRFSGVDVRPWGSLNRFSGFSLRDSGIAPWETAEAVPGCFGRRVTPLKRMSVKI